MGSPRKLISPLHHFLHKKDVKTGGLLFSSVGYFDENPKDAEQARRVGQWVDKCNSVL